MASGTTPSSRAPNCACYFRTLTNFGALSILALDLRGGDKVLTAAEANLRLLIALETFAEDEHGDRHVGMKLLARQAGLTYITARRARDRLVSQKVISYTAGNGNGKVSTFRLLFELKVLSQGEHLEDDNQQHGDGKGAHQAVERVLTSPAEGAHLNALTSGNENTALEAFCSKGISALKDEYTASAAPAADAAPGAAPIAFAYRSMVEDLIAELAPTPTNPA